MLNPLDTSSGHARWSHTGPLLALLLTASMLLPAGCGKTRSPGGAGRLEHSAGAPDLLFVTGSPYQMGWWHGHLLRHRIRALHEQWRRALLDAVASAGSGTGKGGARQSLLEFCEVCRDQAEHRLSERMRQELDGMAQATGLDFEDLMRLDVMRDALRMKGLEPRLTGVAGLAPTADGYEARAWWSGADADLLREEWIVIHQVPDSGRASVRVTWPGSIGAVAGLTTDGLGHLTAAAEIRDRRRLGFGSGYPLLVAVRASLETTTSAAEFLGEAKGTMGHVTVAFSWHPVEATDPLQALAGLQYWTDPPPPFGRRRAAVLAIGPYGEWRAPGAVALRQAVREPALTADEAWLRLPAHADPSGGGAGNGPSAIVTWSAGAGSLTFRASKDGGERRVELGAKPR